MNIINHTKRNPQSMLMFALVKNMQMIPSGVVSRDSRLADPSPALYPVTCRTFSFGSGRGLSYCIICKYKHRVTGRPRQKNLKQINYPCFSKGPLKE